MSNNKTSTCYLDLNMGWLALQIQPISSGPRPLYSPAHYHSHCKAHTLIDSKLSLLDSLYL